MSSTPATIFSFSPDLRQPGRLVSNRPRARGGAGWSAHSSTGLSPRLAHLASCRTRRAKVSARMNIHGELHAYGRDLRRAEVLEVLRDAAVSRGKVVRLERPHVGEAHARALAHRGVDVRHGSLRRKRPGL